MSFTTSPPEATDTATVGSDRYPIGRLWRTGTVAAAVAVAINLVIWAIGRGLLDVSDEFQPLETPILVIVSTVIGMAAATAVFAALVRFVRRPIPVFQIVAAVFLLLSLGGPFSQRSEPGGDAAAVVTLIAMHLAAASVAVYFLTTRTREA